MMRADQEVWEWLLKEELISYKDLANMIEHESCGGILYLWIRGKLDYK